MDTDNLRNQVVHTTIYENWVVYSILSRVRQLTGLSFPPYVTKQLVKSTSFQMVLGLGVMAGSFLPNFAARLPRLRWYRVPFCVRCGYRPSRVRTQIRTAPIRRKMGHYKHEIGIYSIEVSR